MDRLNFENLGSPEEWKALCKKWARPQRKPDRHISSVTVSDLQNRVIVVYGWNRDVVERDVGLVRPAGSSTPAPGHYFWVYGVMPYLKLYDMLPKR